jgi:hypothetical protein
MYEFEQARFNNQESNINMFYELLFKYRSIILHFISPFVSLLLEVDILACYFYILWGHFLLFRTYINT